MLKFYHAPWSRGSGVLWLLEEIGEPYEMEVVDIRAEGGVDETYRAIQPNKKVPAIVHDGVTITERGAISVYLADRFPQAGLAPAIDDPRRGPYLTMMVYCDSVFDPALSAHAHGLSYASNDYSFGVFDDMVRYLERQLTEHTFAVGDTFTAADTQLASSIGFTMNQLKVLPEKQVFKDYLARVEDRPANQRAAKKDADLAMATPFFQKQMGANA